MIMPEIILSYWCGGLRPSWRADNLSHLSLIYPTAKWVTLYEKETPHNVTRCDQWRVDQCSQYRRCLWVDDDIEITSPLALTERPAMADEYHTAHWSIVWSGDNPAIFAGKRVFELYRYPEIDKIKITGTHWASNAKGEKCKRKYY